MKTTSLLAALLSLALAPAARACTGQGTGSCNLELFGAVSDDHTAFWRTATIFDNACRHIGGVNNPYQGMAIDSQLRYTVNLNHLDNRKLNTYIGFCYGSYCYQGDFACKETSSVYETTMTCDHAFPC